MSLCGKDLAVLNGKRFRSAARKKASAIKAALRVKQVEMKASSWNNGRLRPVANDFGFVSKGDERLLDKKHQEQFFTHIVQSYYKYCATTNGDPRALETIFSNLSFSPNPSLEDSSSRFASSSNPDISQILLKMRKLREGLVASHRVDEFATTAYTFMIRAAILTKHSESYLPGLMHLLYTIHPQRTLRDSERIEFASYYMLHLACKMEDYSQAFVVRREFNVTDYRTNQAVSSLIHHNYIKYRAMRTRVDGYKGKLLEDSDGRMRAVTLKCLGKTYFTIEVGFVEDIMRMEWDELRSVYEVGWGVDEWKKWATVKRQKKVEQTPPPAKVKVKEKETIKPMEEKKITENVPVMRGGRQGPSKPRKGYKENGNAIPESWEDDA